MSPPGRCASTGMNANSSPTMQSCNRRGGSQTTRCQSVEAAAVQQSANLPVQ